MYGLPANSERRKQISKEALIKRFEISGRERERFDNSVHKVVITHVLDPESTNIPAGKDVKIIYIMEVHLRESGFDRIAIAVLERLNQSAVYIIRTEDKCKLVLFEKKLFETDWMSDSDVRLSLKGFDLDDVWESFVREISGLKDESPLKDLIEVEVNNDKIKRQIDALRNKMAKEKQVHKRREYFDEILVLESKLK